MRVLYIFFVLMMSCQIASAQTLFSDDFQDGDTQNWQGNPGKGDIRLTRYKKNVSMRLQRDAFAVTLIPTKIFDTINVSVEFAAENLKSKDYCILETSFGGDAWAEIGRVGDGQDDAISLHKISGLAPKAAGHKLLAVRLRISANKDSASCWADNLRVSGKVSPDNLSAHIHSDVLISYAHMGKPFSTAAYKMPVGASKPLYTFNGTLRASMKKVDRFVVLKDDFGYEKHSGRINYLPAFSVDLISDGHALIPTTRGPIPSTHRDWEWIFEPGHVWSEPGDNGLSRASLPIALQERNANCVHNGLMSFLYKDGNISNAIVQFGSETCAYFQFDMWSKLPLSMGEEIANPLALISGYHSEISSRLPRRAISALTGTDTSRIGSPQEISPNNMTAYGFAANGTLYASECMTRHGPDPYCASKPLPSYSMAKSIVASIALMRLEQLYPGARSAKISDYVSQCSTKNWGDVTFENVLNMSTGNYTSKLYDKDEASPKTWKFMGETLHEKKILRACKAHKRKAKPGKIFVYHTTDTYILGTAMQNYLREKTGDFEADIYNDILRPIWQTLNLGPLMNKTRRTYDKAVQPFTGWGLTLHADDLVRIAQFLQAGGKIDGTAWLDSDLLKSALQQNPNDRGHKAINDSLRYRAGFWAYNAGPFVGCKDDMWIPNMSGFGGLATVFMPNGHVYFYVSDGHEYAWRNAAKASNEIKPFCEMK